MPRLLTESQIRRELEKLDGWKLERKFLAKTFSFGTFMEGLDFVRAVALVAESQEHHPDIGIRYTQVKLSVQTHSEGGITAWDVELALAIDRLRTGRREKRSRKAPAVVP